MAGLEIGEGERGRLVVVANFLSPSLPLCYFFATIGKYIVVWTCVFSKVQVTDSPAATLTLAGLLPLEQLAAPWSQPDVTTSFRS